MNATHKTTISRKGLSEAFIQLETETSNLILAANLLKQSKRPGEAAEKFARAARLEEQLFHELETKKLLDKYLSHFFSAASCWAQAGNIYQALSMCNELLERTTLPPRFRQMVQEYRDTLQTRRDQWFTIWTSDRRPAPVQTGI